MNWKRILGIGMVAAPAVALLVAIIAVIVNAVTTIPLKAWLGGGLIFGGAVLSAWTYMKIALYLISKPKWDCDNEHDGH